MIPTPLLITGTAGIAVGFGLAWQLQAGNISELELTHANERAATGRANRAQAERRVTQYAEAQSRATSRGIALRTAVAGAVSAGSGLRVATATAVRAAADTPALCPDTAAALGELLGTSATAYRELAEVCDRHVIDIQALTEREQK